MSGNSSSSSSSRRGKKGGSDKPKQPQRGLGVAQLEKIRLHSQLEEMNMQAYASMHTSIPPASHFAAYGYPHHTMMGFGEMERSNPRYDESQARWNPSQVLPDFQPPTKHFLDTMEEPSAGAMRDYWLSMSGSSSQNAGTGDSQDVDLELRL